MKRTARLLAALMMLVAPAAFAYQVTGPVLEVTDTKIVVEKDKENGRSRGPRTPRSPASSRRARRSPFNTS